MKWCIGLLCCVLSFASHADESAWQAWREGKAVLIMRHALAPGGGDPSGFVLGRCETQRNLNAIGRQQSASLGRSIQQRYQGDVTVYSSEWCRCLDTARLLSVGAVQPLSMLNSFFAGQGSRIDQTRAVLDKFSQYRVPEPTILVTHQVNFTALTSLYPASGESAIVALPLAVPATILLRIDP